MSVSGELLCSFELLKPLDSTALKQQMKKSRNRRSSVMHQSPVSPSLDSIEMLRLTSQQPAHLSAQSY